LVKTCDGGVTTQPFPRDEAEEELRENPQSGHATRSGPEIKDGKLHFFRILPGIG